MLSILSVIRRYKFPLIIIVFIGGFFLLRAILLQKPNTELIYTIKEENLVDTVQVSGSYTTASQTQVLSPANGIIQKLYVKNGDVVKKDTPLFYVESSATQDQVKAAYANYAAALSAVKADNAALYSLQSNMYTAWQAYMNQATSSTYQNNDGSPNTTSRVETQFSIPQTAWLFAQEQFINQQSIIAKDQAALASAKLAYDETQNVSVPAPLSGTVVNLSAAIGDQVMASTATNASPVLVIANLSNPYITASISEDYAARVVEGQKVLVVFDSLKNKTFQGKVTHIDTVGTTTNGVVTYTTKIYLGSVGSVIKPNMTALVTIETLRKDHVLPVPNSAIVSKNGEHFVQKAYSHELIPVTIGVKGITKTEITTGVSKGLVIVASPV